MNEFNPPAYCICFKDKEENIKYLKTNHNDHEIILVSNNLEYMKKILESFNNYLILKQYKGLAIYNINRFSGLKVEEIINGEEMPCEI
jgi:hypothetical protein